MFRIHMSAGCFAVLDCLLITPSAFAQIDLPEGSQPSVQQLQQEINELREEIRELKSERAMPCRGNSPRERFQFKLPDGAVPQPVMEYHLARPPTAPALAQSASIDRAFRRPASTPDLRRDGRNVPPHQFL